MDCSQALISSELLRADETRAMQEASWDCVMAMAMVELVREGVMPVERVSGESGYIAGRRMLYSFYEACKCGFSSECPGLRVSESNALGRDLRSDGCWD